MKDLMENWQRFLVESSLSRIICHHMNEYDNAIISAFRSSFKRSQNRERNRELKAQLFDHGHTLTRILGSYIENFETPQAIEVKEESFVVHNRHSDPTFVKEMAELGEDYGQDSILIIPQGGEGAYLLGTNPKGEFPLYGEQIPVGALRVGCEAEFMSKVGGRPFSFSENTESYEGLSRNSKWAMKKIVERIKREKAAKNPPKS